MFSFLHSMVRPAFDSTVDRTANLIADAAILVAAKNHGAAIAMYSEILQQPHVEDVAFIYYKRSQCYFALNKIKLAIEDAEAGNMLNTQAATALYVNNKYCKTPGNKDFARFTRYSQLTNEIMQHLITLKTAPLPKTESSLITIGFHKTDNLGLNKRVSPSFAATTTQPHKNSFNISKTF